MYKSKGDRDKHMQSVKDYFLRYKIATKSELSQETNLSLATITNILKELQEISFIQRIEDLESTGGRKAKCYTISGQYMLFGLISLQVIKQNIRMSIRIVDLNDKVINNEDIFYQSLLVKDLILIIQQLKDKYSLLFMSLAIPAVVDKGNVTQSDIDGLENCDLKKSIEDEIDICIHIENDVNTALLGYIAMENITQDPIAFIYQPDNHYSGCALYVHQHLVYGKSHFAGELGYLPLASLEEQERMSEDESLNLLVKQTASVISIMNPVYMVISVQNINPVIFQNQIDQLIPKEHQPIFKFVDHMDDYIMNGLIQQCIENTRYRKEETQK